MTPIAFQDLESMSRTIWGEARGEPHMGKMAVAHVILNRLRAQRYGTTIWEICYKPYQFSCWNADDPNQAKTAGVTLSDGILRECVVIALEALAGTTADPTKGSTHYHASHLPKPYWAMGAKQTAEIGGHIFYRDVD